MAHDLDELYPGRFLKGRTLERPMTIRIVSVGGEDLEGDKGVKFKAVVKYKARDKDGQIVDGEIVWNKTNALLAAAVFGTRDFTTWAGRLITIAFDPKVKLGSETPGGIRVSGSPELAEPKRVEIKRPRRKAEVYTLLPTDGQGRTRTLAPNAAPPNSAPPPDPDAPDAEQESAP